MLAARGRPRACAGEHPWSRDRRRAGRSLRVSPPDPGGVPPAGVRAAMDGLPTRDVDGRHRDGEEPVAVADRPKWIAGPGRRTRTPSRLARLGSAGRGESDAARVAI